jgi:hypothetical protein
VQTLHDFMLEAGDEVRKGTDFSGIFQVSQKYNSVIIKALCFGNLKGFRNIGFKFIIHHHLITMIKRLRSESNF